MTIPEKFKLFGHDITVNWEPSLVGRDSCVGRWHPKEMRIELQPDTETSRQQRTWIEQTFIHEMVHAILSQMNEEELTKNERFVDVFAAVLHQALTTGEGELL